MTLLKTVRNSILIRRAISSTPTLCEFKFKAMDLLKLRHQIMEDPHHGKEASSSVSIPDSLGEAVGKRRYELICQLYGEDAYDSRIKRLSLTATKEVPNLVPCEDWRRTHYCLCERDQYSPHFLILYRNLPVRCNCGNWLKLVPYDEFYKVTNERREKRYNEIKNDPKFQPLEELYDKHQAEFDKLIEANKDIDVNSPGAKEIMISMREKWKYLIKARKTIEAVLDMI